AKNKGQSPPDAAALKKFVKTLDKERLEALGVDPSNLDSLFISPRDKQEYVVRKKPPQKGVPDPMAPATVVLYEQTGDGSGRRYVAYENVRVEEVDADKFKQLVPEAR